MTFLEELVKDEILDTVWFPQNKGLTIPKPKGWRARFCDHDCTVEYIRIDHRAGPGCFADNYKGEVCLHCGAVLKEVQTS